MMPTQEGFAAVNLVALKTDDRLIVQLELTIDERPSEIHFQGATCLHARIHLGLEIAIRAASLGLGPVQGHIRALQQVIRVNTVVGRYSNANADIHDDLVTVQLERHSNHFIAEPLRKNCRVSQLPQWDLDNCKLVSTQPRDKIGLSEASS